MRFEETSLKGASLIDLDKFEDERGFFARAWCRQEFEKRDLVSRFVQCNLSFTRRKGTIRGMHYQVAPSEEVKLIRCIRGSIFDVIIDLRPESPTFRQWIGVELSADNRRMLYVPRQFAHGFQTLEDDSEVFYQVSDFYAPQCERGIRWNDSAVGIVWPEEATVISEKDRRWPDFQPEGSPVVDPQTASLEARQLP